MKKPRPLSNAQRQARWRAKRAIRLAETSADWDRFTKAMGVLILELQVESRGMKVKTTRVATMATALERLVKRWPTLPLETKRKLGEVRNAQSTLDELRRVT